MENFKYGDKVKVVKCRKCPESNGLIGTIIGPKSGGYGDYFVDFSEDLTNLGPWTTHNGYGKISTDTGLDIEQKNLVKVNSLKNLIETVKNGTTH